MAEMTPERLARIRDNVYPHHPGYLAYVPEEINRHAVLWHDAARDLLGEVDRVTKLLDQARTLRLAHPSQAVDPAVHTPKRVRAYLDGLGWVLGGGGRVAELWHPPGQPDAAVTVPLIPTAPDYAKVLGILAMELADRLGVGELAVLADIEAAGDE